MRKLRPLTVFVVWLLLVAAHPSSAIRIQFQDYVFTPSGSGSRGRMYIANNRPEMTAVEIHVTTRSYDLDGNETNTDASQHFTVLPRHLLLPPQTEKLVSIIWKGPAKLDTERAYRVVVRQLPIDLQPVAKIEPDKPTSTVKVLTQIRKSLYVSPSSARPGLAVESAGHATGRQGVDLLEIVFANRGSSHQLVDELSLELTPVTENGTPSAPPQLLKLEGADFGGRFNVLAGAQRRILAPWPEGLRPGPVRVTLE